MDKVFTVELSGNSRSYAEIELPAAPYEMLDALDRLRMKSGNEPEWEICTFHCHSELYEYIGGGSIYELNALAQKISEMDAWENTAFTGLVQAQKDKGQGSIPLDTLIDFAYGAQHCHIVNEAHTDEELGHFLVDNSLVPEADDVPDNALGLLDYKKIGRDYRIREGGAFTKGGYVMPVDMKEVHKSIDFAPRKPDYTVLLELCVMDAGETTMLKLPASSEDLSAAFRRLGVENGQDVSYRCSDCRVLALRDAFSMAKSIAAANTAAECLTRLTDQELPKYKALVDAMQIGGLHEAIDLVQRLDEYILTPWQTDYDDIARSELGMILGDKERETLLPCVNLYQYGKALEEKYQLVLTGYGCVERADGQPLMADQQQQQERSQPTMGGMEMV